MPMFFNFAVFIVGGLVFLALLFSFIELLWKLFMEYVYPVLKNAFSKL